MQADLFSKPMPPLTLTIKGKIPSFKNNKMLLVKGPSGRPLPRPLLLTKPEYQKRMQEIEESFRLQLLSAFQTDDGQTLTGSSLRSAIASCVPADDCWMVIREITIRGEFCEPGSEGAAVTIQRL